MFSTRIAPRIATHAFAKQPSYLVSRRFASEAGSTFTKEREAVKKHAAESSELWRKLSIYVTIPCLILASINAKNLWDEHWEHWEHMPPLEERPEYPYQNIRVKNYFWGDGDKTIFWNDKVNHHKRDE